MFELAGLSADSIIISICLEGFFCGLYSGIFVLYLQLQASRNGSANKSHNILFYPLCVLYTLSIATLVGDTTTAAYQILSDTLQTTSLLHALLVTQTSLSGCCDLITQFILIYRCWRVWDRNTRIVIIPLILSFIYLGAWLALVDSYASSGKLNTTFWGYGIGLTSLATSLAVNAIVTGLIVFRIVREFWEVKPMLYDQNSCTTGGCNLRYTILVVIESGTVMFAIQLVRLVLSIVPTKSSSDVLIIGVNQMFNGITPTIILVLVSMRSSFHDGESMVETTENLTFEIAAHDSNSILETGSIGLNIVHQESRDDDIGIQRKNGGESTIIVLYLPYLCRLMEHGETKFEVVHLAASDESNKMLLKH